MDPIKYMYSLSKSKAVLLYVIQMFYYASGVSVDNMSLGDEGEHSLAIAGIILEFLAITLVLSNSPDVHLTGSYKVEEPCYFHWYQYPCIIITPIYTCTRLTWPASAEQGYHGPTNGFKGVIRAGNQIKAVTIGDVALTSTSRTQVAKSDVGDQVGKLGPLGNRTMSTNVPPYPCISIHRNTYSPNSNGTI